MGWASNMSGVKSGMGIKYEGVKSELGIKYDLNEEWNGAPNVDSVKSGKGHQIWMV